MTTSFLAKLLLFGGSTGLVLLFAEGVSRFAEDWAAQNALQYLTRYDPDLGWSKIPNEERVHKTHEYQATERTNSQGLRGPEIPMERTPGRPRILMVGDSFLEGVAVDEEELVSSVARDHLQEALGTAVEVVNGGTVGYSTDQELLFYRLQGRAYKPDVTVLLFYVNDIWFNSQPRYWRGEKPQFVLEGSEIRLTNSPVPRESREYLYEVTGGEGFSRAVRKADSWMGLRSAFYRLGRKAVISVPFVHKRLIESGLGAVPGERMPWRKAPTSELEQAFDITAATLRTFRDEVEANGSEFVVFYVPSRAAIYAEDWRAVRDASAMNDDEWDPKRDGEWLGAFCSETGLRCVIDWDAFRAEAGRLEESGALYFADDTHWTPRGHAVAGRLIAEYVLEQQLLHPPATNVDALSAE